MVASELRQDLHLKIDDAVQISGSVRDVSRAKSSFEVDISKAKVFS
jgi:aspartyl/asparaginyl-tRNA synthetase